MSEWARLVARLKDIQNGDVKWEGISRCGPAHACRQSGGEFGLQPKKQNNTNFWSLKEITFSLEAMQKIIFNLFLGGTVMVEGFMWNVTPKLPCFGSKIKSYFSPNYLRI